MLAVIFFLFAIFFLPISSLACTSFIIGPDTIPDFACPATIQSIQSGPWTSTTTWSSGRVPASGDTVLISHAVTYTSTAGIAKVIGITQGGSLTFSTTQSTKLQVGTLLIQPGGVLEIGSLLSPISTPWTAKLVFRDLSLDPINDPDQWGSGLISIDGTVTMHGASKSAFHRVAEVSTGATTLILAEVPTNWKPNDLLYLPDTRAVLFTTRVTIPQWEEPLIKSINGASVTLITPVAYDHLGAHDFGGALKYAPHVVNLTRNIQISSASASGSRAHAAFLNRSVVDIRYTQWKDMGRTTVAPLDPTINHIGRYALHLHHLYGPAIPGAYQFTLIGNVVTNATDVSQKWGLVIHDSHFGLVQDNIVYKIGGAGIVTEDGDEYHNTIAHNFVGRIVSFTGTRATDAWSKKALGAEGSGFWLRGPANYVHDNVAANCRLYGGTIYAEYAVAGMRPALSGELPSISLIPQQTPILEFAHNEFYASEHGLTVWDIGAEFATVSYPLIPASTLLDTKVWHQYNWGFFGYPTANFILDGFTVRGPLASPLKGLGMWFSDYPTYNLIVKNADIQNLKEGIEVADMTDKKYGVGSLFTVQDSLLQNNMVGVGISTLFKTGGATGFPPRQVALRNNIFNANGIDIDMDYSDVQGTEHFVQTDQTYLYGYQGVNYQLFYLEQRPDFVVPQTSGLRIGCPVAGLTNTQCLTQYGVAIAGSIAPCSSTLAKIGGFVCP